jgi:16S rRNA (cytosine967-C5)-methyltransferase
MVDRAPRRGTAPVQGLAARALAVEAVDGVLASGAALEDAFEGSRLEPRDRGLARMIAGTAMRRYGSIGIILDQLLSRGLPKKSGPLEAILVTAAAQILFLDVPDHAAVDLAVRLARRDDRAQAFSGLANAVLRRLSAEKAERLAALAEDADAPAWLAERWRAAFGPAQAAAIMAAQRREPGLDLTVKRDPAHWAERLGGRLLPTGTVRLAGQGAVTALPGYEDGAWWVQDAAAALPARLLGDVAGQRVADLCAAPGGKTAQLAAAGAAVTAVDRAPARIERLKANLERLELSASLVAADALGYEAAPFDAVLLDAPCSATGTIRRHPDVAWSKRPSDLGALADLQRRLLARAARLTREGGLLVYCTCSLEPEEGSAQVEAFLAEHRGFVREPVSAAEIGGLAEAVTAEGDLRTLPSMLPDPDPAMAGLDGFFAARLRRMR